MYQDIANDDKINFVTKLSDEIDNDNNNKPKGLETAGTRKLPCQLKKMARLVRLVRTSRQVSGLSGVVFSRSAGSESLDTLLAI